MARLTTIYWNENATTIVEASQAIGVSTPRAHTVGYVNAVGALDTARPAGYGKIEWTADGQPLHAEPYDTVVRIDEVV
jgi:hypothetical protein